MAASISVRLLWVSIHVLIGFLYPEAIFSCLSKLETLFPDNGLLGFCNWRGKGPFFKVGNVNPCPEFSCCGFFACLKCLEGFAIPSMPRLPSIENSNSGPQDSASSQHCYFVVQSKLRRLSQSEREQWNSIVSFFWSPRETLVIDIYFSTISFITSPITIKMLLTATITIRWDWICSLTNFVYIFPSQVHFLEKTNVKCCFFYRRDILLHIVIMSLGLYELKVWFSMYPSKTCFTKDQTLLHIWVCL